jgi:hypothetical protein
MFGGHDPTKIAFTAYVDEAGDPGIKTVAPLDERGASEWFVLSAVVVRASNEAHSVEWVKKTRSDLGLLQGPQLHFKSLNSRRRLAVCERLAELDCRIFVAASHKPNMRGYRNDRAAQVRSQEPFYNWVLRILLERVTSYCLHRSTQEYGEPRLLRLELSRRGGLHYHQLVGYHEYLRRQAKPFLSRRTIEWSVLHPDLYFPVRPEQSAGTQIADVAASAFYQAANANASGWEVAYAKALGPRLARQGRTIADHGLTLLPLPPTKPKLSPQQQEIFEYFGYDFR